MSTLYDSRGGIVTLGRSVGVGGEAEVFDITSMQGFVAKKYHKPISARQQNKLRAMLSLSNPDLHKIAAWPSNTLHERPNGPACGWVMRKASGKDIHVLYSPAHRKATFPKADWKYLLFAAMNCAAAFDTVHKLGVVVGDVNQSNILVTDQMVVMLIDCDSFQMKINGTLYPCEVGQALYTPPELQTLDLTGVQRTPNHDRFGLAVLIFHLLFMGRHPFSGRYLGRADMPIEKAIQEHRFAYGRMAGSFQMGPPLHSLTLAEVPQPIETLFERAFASTSTTGDSRPSAIEWYNVLHGVVGSLRGCLADKSHVFGPNLNKCPWCALIQGGAPNFFLPPMPGGAFAFNLAQVWAKIDQVSAPSNVYTIPRPTEYFTPTPWPLQTTAPSEPIVPNILIAPPAFPPLILPPPEYEEVVIAPDSTQNASGLAALGFGIMCPVLAVLGAVLGVAGVGNTVANALIIGISLLIGAIVFAVLWAVLEKNRRDEEEESNKLYTEEVRERRRRNDEHLERCKKELNERKAAAQKTHDEAVRIWEAAMGPYRKEADRRREAVRNSKAQLHQAERAWSSTAASAASHFDRRKRELAALRARHAEIEAQRSTEWQQLQARAREIQKRDYLDSFFIDQATIRDIGPTRKATLASFGIETANDIETKRLEQVPGFGPKRITTVLAWRQEVEAKFVYNAATGVPQQEKQYFESKFQQLLQPIQQPLLNGQLELETIKRSAESELAKIYANINGWARYCHQMEADAKSIPTGL
jgi:DNA-binding helix-hairpin-helix protein with protein kinase domain